MDQVDGYVCICDAGYDGTLCDNNIDDCSPNPCLNGGSCTDGVNSFTCSCAAGYEGDTCGTGRRVQSIAKPISKIEHALKNVILRWPSIYTIFQKYVDEYRSVLIWNL